MPVSAPCLNASSPTLYATLQRSLPATVCSLRYVCTNRCTLQLPPHPPEGARPHTGVAPAAAPTTTAICTAATNVTTHGVGCMGFGVGCSLHVLPAATIDHDEERQLHGTVTKSRSLQAACWRTCRGVCLEARQLQIATALFMQTHVTISSLRCTHDGCEHHAATRRRARMLNVAPDLSSRLSLPLPCSRPVQGSHPTPSPAHNTMLAPRIPKRVQLQVNGTCAQVSKRAQSSDMHIMTK